jgi:hypothetical protein
MRQVSSLNRGRGKAHPERAGAVPVPRPSHHWPGRGGAAFPGGENAAATWNPALIKQEGAAVGREFAGKGVNVSLGPTTNLVRDPRWGLGPTTNLVRDPRWGRTYQTRGEESRARPPSCGRSCGDLTRLPAQQRRVPPGLPAPGARCWPRERGRANHHTGPSCPV